MLDSLRRGALDHLVLYKKKTYSTKTNFISNLIGSVWTAIFSLMFVPLYLPYIGIEGYGLIGIFSVVQAFIILLDFGLSPTINREFAMLATDPAKSQEMHDMKRTLEIPNWISAVFIVVFCSILAPFIATYWVQPKELSRATVTEALIIMGINIAIQFTSSFYVGGLIGLQKLLPLNIINMTCSTLRSAGGFFVVAVISPTIQAFLIWQGVVAIIQLVLVVLLLRGSLPETGRKGTFKKDLLKKVFRFATGMTGITIVSLILTQTDKVVLSRLISLEDFGYYTLAVTISGMAVATIVSAITNSVYPRFSGYVALNDESNLREFYHRSSQILSAFLMPIVTVIAVFSYEILLIWTHNRLIANNTALLLTIVVIGTGLNGLMWLPYHLQLSYGWTKLGFYMNLISIFVLVPVAIILGKQYGALGGAGAFALLNVCYILITIQIMHRRLLKGEKVRWYFQDILLPLLISITTVSMGRYFFVQDWETPVKLGYFVVLTILSFGLIVVALPNLRLLVVSGSRRFFR